MVSIQRFCVICRERGYSSAPVVAINDKGEGFCEEHAANIPGLRRVDAVIDLTKAVGKSGDKKIDGGYDMDEVLYRRKDLW